MKHIVIASDSFKGSLTSAEAGEAIAEAFRMLYPDCRLTVLPVADGGEGSLDAIAGMKGCRTHTVATLDPLLRDIDARWLSLDVGGVQTAVIELAQASGLTLLGRDELNPEETSTYGTGVIVRSALAHGCREVIITLGGSATNDGGSGLLSAIGVDFLTDSGQIAIPRGKDLAAITRIDASHIMPQARQAHFTLACDVTNPLYGPQGAALVFARQKGADAQMAGRLDDGLRHFASVLHARCGRDVASMPGSGAAGGVAAGMMAMTDASICPGAEMILDIAGFDRAADDASLIVTGEGCYDAQTAGGKLPSVVARRAAARGIPVAIVCGCRKDDGTPAGTPPCEVIVTCPPDMPLDVAMRREQARANIIAAVTSAMRPGWRQ